MGKNHHRQMKQYEQDHDQVSRRSGLISLFDLLRGGSNSIFNPDKRLRNKVCGEEFSQDVSRSVDSGYQFDYDSCESKQPMLGDAKRSVKNLIDEEMVIEDSGKQDNNASEYEHFSNDADVNSLVREILIRIQQQSSRGIEQIQKDNFYIQDKNHTRFVKQLADATKVILYEKLIGRVHVGLDGKIQYSRELTNAIKTLISHKDLFFKLLEDPNSELARSVNDLINSELGKCSDQKENDHGKLSLFSKRRARPQETSPLSVDESSEDSQGSVILDPVSKTSSSSYSENSSVLESKRISYFCFTEIKRRLKRAMGKDREEVFPMIELTRSKSRRDSFGRMSLSKNPHLEAEIHPKRLSDPKLSDFESAESVDMALKNEIVRPSEEKVISSNLEQKNHSFDKLTDETFDDKFPKMQDSEFSTNRCSMPDCTSLPSLHPPRQSSMPPALTRSFTFLRSNIYSEVLGQVNNANTDVDHLSDRYVVVASCESKEELCAKIDSQDLSTIKTENNVIGDSEDEEKLPFELISAAIPDADHDELVTVDEKSTAPSQTISTDGNLGSGKTEEFDYVTSRVDHRTSPTSVLEPEYSEGEISPHQTKNSHDELLITPLQINFEEGGDLLERKPDKSPLVKKSCDDNELKLKKYIKEILTASDFTWDTLYAQYLSSDQLLDMSLYDTEMDSDQLSNDYILLLDLLNEVLSHSCARNFCCSPWMSVSKPLGDIESTFQEVVEVVVSHLHPSPPPRGIEEIVAKKILKDGSCTDFRDDVETIGTEIADLILQKLVIDTVVQMILL